MNDLFVHQSPQLLQHPGMFHCQQRDGKDPFRIQGNASLFLPDCAVASQAEGVDEHALDKGAPAADADAVPDPDGQTALDQGNIGGGAAHVHDHAVGLACQLHTSQDAGCRAAENGFHRPEAGETLVHQTAVRSYHQDGRGDPHGGEGAPDGIQELPDDGYQSGVQKGAGSPLDAVQTAEQFTAADDGNVRKLGKSPFCLLFRYGPVVHGVFFNDPQALRLGQPLPGAGQDGIPIRIRQDFAVVGAAAGAGVNVLGVCDAVGRADPLHGFPVLADEDKPGPAAFAFHAGIGGQGGGERGYVRLAQKRGIQLSQSGQNAPGEIFFGGERFGGGQHGLVRKAINDDVRIGPAGVDPNAQLHLSFRPFPFLIMIRMK